MAAPVFAVIGHGNEEPVEYEERTKVPPGYTVVLLTKPGQPFAAMDASFLWEKMYNEPSLFQDPIANKALIETASAGNQLRIYEEGAPMPAMRYYPQSYFPEPSRYASKLLLAGIYKLPLPYPHMESKSITGSTTGALTESQFQELYSGDANRILRENIQEIAGPRILMYKLLDENLFMYKIEDLLAMNGPGVYYFFNCRYVKGLKAKIEDFIGRIRADYASVLRTTFPEPTDSKDLSLWTSHGYALRGVFNRFNLLLQELLQATNMLPEEKLPWLRNILLDGTYLEGDEELIKIKEREVLSNANLMVTIDKVRALQGTQSGFWHRDNVDHFLALQKRKYLQMFDEEFGPLLRRLPLTRQKSNLGQAKYTRTGGKQKRRSRQKTNRNTKRKRKTRRNRRRV
jgi:hypothetical protein